MASRLQYQVPRAPLPGAPEELADLVETLHRSGTLRALNSFFGRLGAVSKVGLAEVNSEPGRNLVGALLVLGECLAKLPAADLQPLVEGWSDGLHRVGRLKDQQAPGTLALVRLARAPDTRRGMAAVLLLLNRLGAAATRDKDR